jgi:hypothetical protein
VIDVTKREFLPLTFDAIYCRESAIYIEDKAEVLSKFLVRTLDYMEVGWDYIVDIGLECGGIKFSRIREYYVNHNFML